MFPGDFLDVRLSLLLSLKPNFSEKAASTPPTPSTLFIREKMISSTNSEKIFKFFMPVNFTTVTDGYSTRCSVQYIEQILID